MLNRPFISPRNDRAEVLAYDKNTEALVIVKSFHGTFYTIETAPAKFSLCSVQYVQRNFEILGPIKPKGSFYEG